MRAGTARAPESGDPFFNLAGRVRKLSAVVGDPARVLAGTDCGFDTSAGWGRVAEDVVWAKLKSLRDGAQLASEKLFS